MKPCNCMGQVITEELCMLMNGNICNFSFPVFVQMIRTLLFINLFRKDAMDVWKIWHRCSITLRQILLWIRYYPRPQDDEFVTNLTSPLPSADIQAKLHPSDKMKMLHNWILRIDCDMFVFYLHSTWHFTEQTRNIQSIHNNNW